METPMALMPPTLSRAAIDWVNDPEARPAYALDHDFGLLA